MNPAFFFEAHKCMQFNWLSRVEVGIGLVGIALVADLRVAEGAAGGGMSESFVHPPSMELSALIMSLTPAMVVPLSSSP